MRETPAYTAFFVMVLVIVVGPCYVAAGQYCPGAVVVAAPKTKGTAQMGYLPGPRSTVASSAGDANTSARVPDASRRYSGQSDRNPVTLSHARHCTPTRRRGGPHTPRRVNKTDRLGIICDTNILCLLIAYHAPSPAILLFAIYELASLSVIFELTWVQAPARWLLG